MTKPSKLSICLLAAFLIPLAGCETLYRQGEAQGRDREAQLRDREAHVRDREAQVRDREAQIRDREAQIRDREAQMRDREVQTRDREVQASDRKAQAGDVKVPVSEHKAQVRDSQAKGRAAFSAYDVSSIRDFYKQGNKLGNTAGRVMKLQRGETYPFGYTWRPLPAELESRLSALPDGFIRVIIGTDIVILNVRTRVAADLVNVLAI